MEFRKIASVFPGTHMCVPLACSSGIFQIIPCFHCHDRMTSLHLLLIRHQSARWVCAHTFPVLCVCVCIYIYLCVCVCVCVCVCGQPLFLWVRVRQAELLLLHLRPPDKHELLHLLLPSLVSASAAEQETGGHFVPHCQTAQSLECPLHSAN